MTFLFTFSSLIALAAVAMLWIIKKKDNGLATVVKFLAVLFAIPIGLGFLFLPAGIVFSIFMTGGSDTGTPTSVAVRNAADLKRVTNVEFPDVVAVDSCTFLDFSNDLTQVKLVPRKPYEKKFFKRLDKAVGNDSCWEKDEDVYRYYIHPEKDPTEFDRTKGHYRKMTDKDGDGVNDAYDEDGLYIRVIVPFLNNTPLKDTIVVEYGYWIGH